MPRPRWRQASLQSRSNGRSPETGRPGMCMGFFVFAFSLSLEVCTRIWARAVAVAAQTLRRNGSRPGRERRYMPPDMTEVQVQRIALRGGSSGGEAKAATQPQPIAPPPPTHPQAVRSAGGKLPRACRWPGDAQRNARQLVGTGREKGELAAGICTWEPQLLRLLPLLPQRLDDEERLIGHRRRRPPLLDWARLRAAVRGAGFAPTFRCTCPRWWPPWRFLQISTNQRQE